MKYKVGDKVRIKKNLHKIEHFAGGYMSEMKAFEGRTMTISTVLDEDRYKLLEDSYCYTWDIRAFMKVKTAKDDSDSNESDSSEILEEVLNSFNKQLEERNKEFNSVLETNLKQFTKEIKQRTIYDEMIQDQVLEKAKQLSLEGIKEELHKDTDEYIKNMKKVYKEDFIVWKYNDDTTFEAKQIKEIIEGLKKQGIDLEIGD